MNNFDDELDGVTPTHAPATTTAAPATTTTNATAVATAVVKPVTTAVADDDGAFEYGDENLRPKTRLPNLRPDKGSVSRVFLIKGVKPRAKETHFIVAPGTKGMTVICPGANCPECAKGDGHGSRTRIVALAGKYTNAQAKDGKFPGGTTKLDYVVGYLGLSRTSYADLMDLPSEGETVHDIDVRLSHKTNGIGYTLNRMGLTAYTKLKDEAVVAELAAPFIDGRELTGRIGKKVSLIDLKIMIGGSDEASMDALDAIE